MTILMKLKDEGDVLNRASFLFLNRLVFRKEVYISMIQVCVKIICDRCGKSIFIANCDSYTIDNFAELSVRITARNVYDNTEDILDLCPDCLSKFEDLYKDYLVFRK